MSNLLRALFVFSLAFSIHIAVWRVIIPARQTAALLLIFFGSLAAWLVASYFLTGRWLTAVDLWQAIHVTIFHAAFTLAYAAAYSAIEHRSPSMALLTAVADAGHDGYASDALEDVIADGHPVGLRLRAMVTDGMAVSGEGTYCLTRKGRAWVSVLTFWQRLLSLPFGG